MRALVVFFSMDGNTRFAGQNIAGQYEADLLELKTKKEFPSEGFGKYFWCGKTAVFKQKPKLTNELISLSQYDTIVMGTPVWAGSFSSPIRTFINQYKIEGKRIAMFACHSGGGGAKCFARLKKALPNNTFIGTADFLDPLKGNKKENLDKILAWAATLGI